MEDEFWEERMGEGKAYGIIDRNSSNRHTPRHLHNTKQAIHAIQRAPLHRNTDDRQRCASCDHAGEMSGSTGGGDDDFEASRDGGLGEGGHAVRGTVCGGDGYVVGDVEGGEEGEAGFKDGEVGVRAHCYGDEGLAVGRGLL